MADGTSSEDESDESLDARSEKFDPLKVLYSPKSRLASSSAPVYDNISKFESALYSRSVSTKVRMTHIVVTCSSHMRVSLGAFGRTKAKKNSFE